MSTTNTEIVFDSSTAAGSLQDLQDILEGLETTIADMSTAMKGAFSPEDTGLSQMAENVNGIAESLDTLVEKMESLVALMTPQETGFFDGLVEGVDVFNTLADGRTNLEEISEGINAGLKKVREGKSGNFNIFKVLIPDTRELGGSMASAFSSAVKDVPGTFEKLGSVIHGAWDKAKDFGAGMGFLTSPMGLVVIGITALIAIIVLLIANWDTVSAAVGRFCDWLSVGLSQFDAFVQGVFATDWTQVLGPLGNVVNALFTNMEGIWNSIKQIFDGIITFVKGVFSGDWQMAWDGIVKLFAGIWDGIVAAINGVIGLLNGIQFEIPDWDIFGDLGGRSFNLNIPTINAPQIPLLAKGAVLPANKPFLAVVGDQKHGTNVEAPLATIQEAVALCMQDVMASNLAGHEATVAVLREILEAVLGIHIGDDTVGQAVARYNAKMAIIKGGG